MSRPRVLIADDHRLLADAYERLLGDGYEVVGKAADGRELVEMAERLRPDVIVLDVSMPRLNGFYAALRIRETRADARLIFVTMHKDARMAARALEAGASAFVVKASAAADLEQAIAAALNGETYVTPLIPAREIEAARAVPAREGRRLTPRQREVLQLLAEGGVRRRRSPCPGREGAGVAPQSGRRRRVRPATGTRS